MSLPTRRLPYSILAMLVLIWLAAGTGHAAAAVDHPQPDSGPLATPLTSANIDDSASAEWVDGAEHPLANALRLRAFVWTQSAPTLGGYFLFGESSQPGPRHLRLGFKTPLAVGSMLTRGGDQLSVLRSNAPYPGNMADESQGMPASQSNHKSPRCRRDQVVSNSAARCSSSVPSSRR